MKKFILPFLSAVVLLSSCSQALYKNKYDWVKADRSVQHTECDPVVVKPTVVRSVLPDEVADTNWIVMAPAVTSKEESILPAAPLTPVKTSVSSTKEIREELQGDPEKKAARKKRRAERKEDKPAGTEWVRVIAVILTFGLLLAFGWVALGPVGLLLVILGILAVLVAVLIVLSIVLGILFDFGATIVQSYSETH